MSLVKALTISPILRGVPTRIKISTKIRPCNVGQAIMLLLIVQAAVTSGANLDSTFITSISDLKSVEKSIIFLNNLRKNL